MIFISGVKAHEGGFDLILLDLMMPKLNGLEFLQALVQSPPREKNGPTILLTNLAHDPVIKEGLAKGAKDYLVKSDLTPDELVERVKQFLL